MMMMLLLLLLATTTTTVVADEVCKAWPEIGKASFRVEMPVIGGWRRSASVIQQGATERSEAATVMEKQCVSFNSDIDWLSTADESVRYAATDVKTTVCGAEIRVRDCHDLEGKLLFIIEADTCLQAREYRILRCGDGAQQDAAECAKNGRVDYLFAPLYGIWSLRYLDYNFTVNYLGKTPQLYATSEVGSVFTRSVDVTVVQSTADMLTAEQRNEANGLVALLLTTRLFGKFEDNDSCSSFYTFGIPVLVIVGLICLAVCVLAVRHRMTRA